LTKRIEKPWRPEKILCRRFNLMYPFEGMPASMIPLDDQKDKEKNKMKER
jgi:hypothetical protein